MSHTATITTSSKDTTSATPAQVEATSKSQPLDASKLRSHRTTNPRAVPTDAERLSSLGSVCTDHMVTVKWNAGTGWSEPQLEPYGALALLPTASVLHYATECFEGMKAYRGYDGKLRLFRPSCNTQRMLVSATRVSLPGFDPIELQKLVVALLAVDGPKWLPISDTESYLYLRPTLIGTTGSLNPQAPEDALLFIVASYFNIFPEAESTGLKLLASQEDMVRAWPGGFGHAKIGANYGPTFLAQRLAKEMGYQQVLWLLGSNNQITEAGASNFFVVWRTREGRVQIVTAPLDGKIILDGITRRSILELAREYLIMDVANKVGYLETVDVLEHNFTMDDVMEAYRENRLLEAFATGTAVYGSDLITSPMISFRYMLTLSVCSFLLSRSKRLASETRVFHSQKKLSTATFSKKN